MKIKIVSEFKRKGEQYEKGDIVDLPDGVAKSVIEKGYAEEAEDEGEDVPELGEEDEGSEEISEISEGDEEYQKVKEDIMGEKKTPGSWNPPQDNPPEPEDHEPLIGRVIRKGEGGEDNTPFAVVRVNGEGEEKSLWCHKVLEDLFEQMKIGDRVGVRYMGKKKSGSSDYEYLNYRYSLRDENNNLKVSQ